MENTIKIIESHIKMLEAEIRTLNAKWEENDTKREHDKLTNCTTNSWAWSKVEEEMCWQRTNECTSQIQRLNTILMDIEKTKK